MASIDKVDLHSGADDFPDDVPEENGATHIGWFVRWVIERGLFVAEEGTPADVIDAVRTGTMSGRDFVMEHLDGKLWPSDLSEEGQAFADTHYDGYLKDVGGLLIQDLESVYYAEDSDANYRMVAAALNERWERFKAEASGT
ncbi:MAG: hypothetical protein KIS73_00545 [Enhydrobacter sp.]|nr:hypothetical protein [Enhydrobacter sp.]